MVGENHQWARKKIKSLVEEGNRKKDIIRWITDEIGKKHKASGIAPCPFASKVIKDKTYEIIEAKVDLGNQIAHICDIIDIFKLDIVIVYCSNAITERRLKNICNKIQKQKPKAAIMYDHPDNDGLVAGMQFSYQKCPLVMIQPLSKLKAAQKTLKEKTNWYQIVGNEDMFV